MGKSPLLDHRQFGMYPFMFRMAIPALCGRIELVQFSMDGGKIPQLRGDIGMARVTAVVHCFRAPGRNVA